MLVESDQIAFDLSDVIVPKHIAFCITGVDDFIAILTIFFGPLKRIPDVVGVGSTVFIYASMNPSNMLSASFHFFPPSILLPQVSPIIALIVLLRLWCWLWCWLRAGELVMRID